MKVPHKTGFRGYVDSSGAVVYVPLPSTQKRVQEQTRLIKQAEDKKLLEAQIQALTNRNEFLEEVIAEMAVMIYDN